MPKSMLSFDRGIPIAHCLDSSGKKILTIHITDDQSDPDITVDRIEELIDDEDIESIKNMMKLTNIEVKMIQKALASGSEEDFNKLNDRLRLALKSLKDLATRKLKRKIRFDKSDDIDKVVPLIGGSGVKFDRSIFLTGPSGSGKSFLAKEIIKHDEKARCIVVFSKISDDESLNDLRKLKISKSSFPDQHDGGARMIKIKLDTIEDVLDVPSNEMLKDCVVFFDDIDSFSKDIADFLSAYRDSLLECGRHHNICVLSTSHQLYNWAKTRTILNEAILVAMFPHSNRRNAMMFLRDRMGLSKQKIESILNECMECSRELVCRMSAPNVIIHAKGVEII